MKEKVIEVTKVIVIAALILLMGCNLFERPEPVEKTVMTTGLNQVKIELDGVTYYWVSHPHSSSSGKLVCPARDKAIIDGKTK